MNSSNLNFKNTRKREIYLDSVGGLLITYMIVMHCAQWSSVFPLFQKYTSIISFFMPWFFFKSGMFYRPQNTKDVVKKGYKRLIVPFLIFSVIGTLELWAIFAVKRTLTVISVINSIGSVILNGSFPGNLALWFLVSLFFVRIIFNIMNNAITHSSFLHSILLKAILIFLGLIFIPLYYIRLKYEIVIPYYFFNVSSGLAFYSLGYYLKITIQKIKTIILITLFYVLLVIFMPISIDMRTGNSSNILLLIPYALLGILSFNLCSKRFFNKDNLFSEIGKDTMPFYCIHWCVIELVTLFFCNSQGPNFTYFIILILANIVLLPLCTKMIYHSRFKVIFKT